MTNVRRPIHLQLRPTSALVNGGANGATTPFSLSAPATLVAGAVQQDNAIIGASPHETSNNLLGAPTTNGATQAPIRPSALMNFSTSTMMAPSTRLRPPAADLLLQAPITRQQANSRQHATNNHHHQKQQHLNNHSTTTTSRVNVSQQQLQSPKALSPSSAFNDSLPSQILPHLFVGNQEQTNRETVSKLNIKYILSLGLLPQLLQTSGCTTSVSPSSPANNKAAASSTNKTTTNQPMSAESNPLSNQHHHHQILMPNRDESRDFKIRMRPAAQQAQAAAAAASGGAQPQPNGMTHNLRHQRNSQTLSNVAAATTTTNLDLHQNPGRRLASNQDRLAQQQQQQQQTTTPLDNCNEHEVPMDGESCCRRRQLERESSHQMMASEPLIDGGGDDDENKSVGRPSSIQCKCINISDGADQSLMSFFDEAIAFIEEARRKKCNILVHCLAGISRSPTIAIAYLMRAQSLHWREAYDLVKHCRPQIDPNLNFMGQLRIYNKMLMRNNNDPQQQKQQQRQQLTAAAVAAVDDRVKY